MPSCSLKICKNRGSDKGKSKIQKEFEKRAGKISFHKFPKDANTRLVWLDRLGISNSDIPQNAYLCSVHFADTDFDRSSHFNVRLRANALPKQVSECCMEIDDKKEESRSQTANDIVVPLSINVKAIVEDSLHQPGLLTSIIQREVKDHEIQPTQLNSSSTIIPNHDLSDRIFELKCSPTSTPKRRKLETMSFLTEPTLHDSPRELFLKNVLKNSKLMFKKKIKNLQDQVRRRDARIAKMEKIIKKLMAIDKMNKNL